MKARWIPALVTLSAGFVTSIVLIVNRYSNTEAMAILLAVMVVFYVIGLIIKGVAMKFLIVVEEEEEKEDVEITENDSQEKEKSEEKKTETEGSTQEKEKES